MTELLMFEVDVQNVTEKGKKVGPPWIFLLGVFAKISSLLIAILVGGENGKIL